MTVTGLVDLEPSGFSHEAFFYSDDAEFLDITAAFVREGVDVGDVVLVAVSGPRFAALEELFAHEESVLLMDMAVVGANPARIIPLWRDFLDESLALGRTVRGVGEPIWSGRSAAEIAEAHQHESLLNLAFGADAPWRLLCPYDVTALVPAVIELARANHPVIVEGTGRRPSPTYRPETATGALGDQPFPPPAEPPTELAFGAGELAEVRRIVARSCEALGVPRAVTEDLTLAVDEIACNSLLHGGGAGVLRIWTQDDALVCEVSDAGVIRSPLIGRLRPTLEQPGGRGVWMANHLCDLVQVRSGPAGTVVRLHARRR